MILVMQGITREKEKNEETRKIRRGKGERRKLIDKTILLSLKEKLFSNEGVVIEMHNT